MFLSQRIAADPKYLILTHKGDVRSIVDIRVKIMHAEKFIVGTDQLNTYGSLEDMEERHRNEIGFQKTNLEQRAEIYKKYARLPYPIIFLENNFSGMLIETTKHNNIMVTFINSGDGLITRQSDIDSKQKAYVQKHAYVGVTAFEAPLTDSCINPFCTTKAHCYSELAELFFRNAQDDAMTRHILMLFQIGEILLFLNVTNKKVNKYKLNKQEVVKIPKPLINKYEYHILDVYRDHAPYVNQNDIEKQMFYTAHEARERRAHFVRGHFKERATGLYWWNAFMRNARNAKKGFVDKDYSLIK